MTLRLKPVSRLVNKACRARQKTHYGLLVGSLFLASPLYAQDSDGDGITDIDEGFIGSVASSFEEPVIDGTGYKLIAEADAPLWSTTDPQGVIEFWKSGFLAVPSFEGDQFAEIKANGVGSLYIDVATVPGETLDWQVAHRGRDASDTATISAGAPGQAETLLETMTTDSTAWVSYDGSYVVPAGQETTRISFTPVVEAGVTTPGGFIDGLILSSQSRDTDGDGTPDYLDTDSDNDGTLDEVEYQDGGTSDADNDGIPDHLDSDRDSDGDGISDIDEGALGSSVASSFEVPVIAGNRNELVPEGDLPLWETTDEEGVIEVWKSGFANVPAFEGGQLAEITANNVGVLFFDIETVPGETLDWEVAHRGRFGTETAIVTAGAPGQTGTLQETMVTDPEAWVLYDGAYVVPAGQTTTRFTFTPEGENGEARLGGFLDGLVITSQSHDTDGDGIADYLDLDSDNDGIPDEVETEAGEPRDADGDGIPDHRETDSDDDGILDSEEGGENGTLDTDGDSVPDYRDRDSDGDRIADLIEGTSDYDGDGIPDYLDTDSDADGIPDSEEGTGDSDGNGIPDYLDDSDADTDGDGLLDDVEGDVDTDGDGLLDFEDPDSDNDGIPDAIEAFIGGQGPVDSDADGVYDYQDIDSDNDGIPDLTETDADFDADGTANFRDVDSDDDGISDLYESTADSLAVASLDSNWDGMIDIDADFVGSNGLADSLEEGPDTGVTVYALANSDADTQPDYLDRDSDNDGLFDTQEASQLDADLNGIVDEVLTAWPYAPDQDADGVADYRDLDSDNDGLSDLQETVGIDADGNGTLDSFSDADFDGVDDLYFSVVPADTDGDGLANYRDLDSDQDGISDLAESNGSDTDRNGLVDDFIDLNGDGMGDSLLVTPLLLLDDDGDGTPNYLDLDSDGNGLFDRVEFGGEDQDNDGMVDGFVDIDGDGLYKEQPDEVVIDVVSDEGMLFTGLTGGVGCVLTTEKRPFDPLFALGLLFAGLGLRRRKQ